MAFARRRQHRLALAGGAPHQEDTMDRRMHGPIRVATILIATLASTATARAQRPGSAPTVLATDTKQNAVSPRLTGFMLGAHTIGAQGISISGADVDGTLSTGFGAGMGVMVGYGFNRIWSVYTSLDGARQRASGSMDIDGTFGLAHAEIGARANLPFGTPTTVPYASASFGSRALDAKVKDNTGDSYDISLSGGMFAIGGGVQHFISSTLALDGGLELGVGKFGHYDEDGDESDITVNSSTSVRLRFGVTWRPSGRSSK
jgi:hypothetical protein